MSVYSGISGGGAQPKLQLHAGYHLRAAGAKRGFVSVEESEHLLARNEFIGNLYNAFQTEKSMEMLVKTIVANYILEGIYFYSGFMFFYNLGRNQLMPGSVQEIRYINRDENTHLWLFRNILIELKKEQPDLFTEQYIDEYRSMIKEGCEQEIKWGTLRNRR